MEMKISGPTINFLAQMIVGGSDSSKPDYKTGSDLLAFFYTYGSNDLSLSGDSRNKYVIRKLKEFNGTSAIYEIIKRTLPCLDLDRDSFDVPHNFNEYLKKDGYQLRPLNTNVIYPEWGTPQYGNFVEFDVQPINGNTVKTSTVINLNQHFINEQIRKANDKLSAGDYDGAITNCYSLVEGLIKEMLHRKEATFKADEGDIRTLYSNLAEAMNLNPKGENMESYLKAILEGLKKQISGLYTLANKSSDRHAQKYKPKRHHAKLAVNATFSLCEFLLDSFEYQKNKQSSQVATGTKQEELA